MVSYLKGKLSDDHGANELARLPATRRKRRSPSLGSRRHLRRGRQLTTDHKTRCPTIDATIVANPQWRTPCHARTTQFPFVIRSNAAVPPTTPAQLPRRSVTPKPVLAPRSERLRCRCLRRN